MANTVGSKSFEPDEFMSKWASGEISAPQDHDLKSSIISAFNLIDNDKYVYHAMASVTLDQVQQAISHGAERGMHAWYIDSEQKVIASPSRADIEAYTKIFLSTTSTAKALTSLEKNAKKGSIRASVAVHLTTNRTFPSNVTIPKLKSAHINPYLDYWSWSCRELEWAGPDKSTANIRQSHHILPIFYLHFGCACPSFESLEAIKQVAKKRPVIEVGSGNGYWTFLLRRLGLTVTAVDNGDSLWRTMWIPDTIKTDAVKYLSRNSGGKEAVLLMVYPQVTTEFTVGTLKSYQGSTICVVGTQNTNGYTAFKDTIIDEYMSRQYPNFERVMQTPIPSFAGKDEALFVFEKQS